MSVRVRVSNPNERSKVTDIFYLYNCKLGLGLGLVTLILSSVVNPNMNLDPNSKIIYRKNGCDDSGGSVYYCRLWRAFRDVSGYKTDLNRFHVVFSSFLERSNNVMEFSTLTKRNTSPHFHPASRLKPSGRKFVHAAGKM